MKIYNNPLNSLLKESVRLPRKNEIQSSYLFFSHHCNSDIILNCLFGCYLYFNY